MLLDASSAGAGAALGILFLIGLVFLGALYFAPTIVAYMRHTEQRLPVLVLNLLLGWTLVGWVVSMVMAVGRTDGQATSQVVIHQYGSQPPVVSQPGSTPTN